MLYSLYEAQHMALAPLRFDGGADARLVRPPVQPVRLLAAVAAPRRLERSLPARHRALRKTGVESRRASRSRWRRKSRSATDPFQAGAARSRARCSSSRRSRATTRRCCAIRCARCWPSTMCGSPTGSMRAWCRSPRGRSTSTTTSTTCATGSRCSRPTLHVISVCQPTVPVLAAVSLMAAQRRGAAARRWP